MIYRNDIDGLRAIAVIAVILSHVQMLPGGYIGVDVFFVISGFLIAPSIFEKMKANTFSITEFYTRRAKRLLPQVYALIFVSFIGAYLLFLPNEMISFAKSARETVLFISNFYFLSQTGYFSPDSITQPLLHTWSLAIEEQFYFIAPAMIYVLLKSKRPLLWGLLIGLSSFIASATTTPFWPSTNFFMLPFRIWEFAIGAAIAYMPRTSVRLANVMGIFGLSIIVISACALTEGSIFPGLNAVPPTIGAALIIWAGRETYLSRALSLAPVRLTGRASYSIYIWHWPIIVFYSYYTFNDFSLSSQLAMISASVIVGFLFWFIFEEPMRHSTLSYKKTVYAVISASVSIFAIAFFVKEERGMPYRLNEEAQLMAASADDKHEFFPNCLLPVNSESFDTDGANLCRLGVKTGKPIFALWGDSHAASIAFAASEEAHKHQLTGIGVFSAACPPIVNSPGGQENNISECIGNNTHAIKLFKQLGIKYVFMHARWSNLNQDAYQDGLVKTFGNTSNRDPQHLINTAITETINALRDEGIIPIFIEGVPTIEKNGILHFTRIIQTGHALNAFRSRSEIEELNRRSNIAFAMHPNVTVLSPADYFCSKERCQVVMNGQTLTLDGDHMTKAFSEMLSGLFSEDFSIIHDEQCKGTINCT